MPTMDTHYGWAVSPYSAKTRSYLTYKGAPYRDMEPSVLRLMRVIRPAVGRPIMPTVHLAGGGWLQDSSLIIDHFEDENPEPGVHPPSAVQRLASYLLEVFADEWLPMAALHYRWNIEENVSFALNDFARSGLPWVPRVLGRRVVAPFARKMRGYLPILGVDEGIIPGVADTVGLTVRAMEAQLAESAYLLGNRPSLGDFALFGPLWAHLYRDPGSSYLFDEAPNVQRWMGALEAGVAPEGDFIEGDVPEALDGLFACILKDQWSWITTLVEAIDAYCAQHPDAHRVPRALGEAEFQVRGRPGRRKLITFVQWKAQRARRAYEACDGGADPWLRRVLGLPPDADVSEQITPISNPLEVVDFKPVLGSRAP